MAISEPVSGDIFTEFRGTLSRLSWPTSASPSRRREWIAAAATALLFALLFAQPFVALLQDWWMLPDAGHGLLLGPVAIWLAWRSGIRDDAKPSPVLGVFLLVIAVLLRCASGLAGELFTRRSSMLMGLVGLTIYHYGTRQVIRWWLPFTLAALSVPLPELVTQKLAFPMQLQASKMGALLAMRGIPVRLAGNIIHLPQRDLFVTEACSGLRSLTALLSVAVLMSALLLETVIGRVVLVGVAIPIAIVVNGIRVFMTGFLVFFVSPALGEGFMHLTEGWLLFLVSLTTLGAVGWGLSALETRVQGSPAGTADDGF